MAMTIASKMAQTREHGKRPTSIAKDREAVLLVLTPMHETDFSQKQLKKRRQYGLTCEGLVTNLMNDTIFPIILY